MKKKFIHYIFFFFILTLSVIFLLLLFNLFFSSSPRYQEVVFKFEKGSSREKKEKLIFYKSKNHNKIYDYFNIKSEEYNSNDYSGFLINRNCGTLESGKKELFFLSDKHGFRENKDTLYDQTNYILLGDSFVESICINKPHDLKSNLQKINNNLSFLNLGKQGTDYPQQLKILLKITKDTNFDTLVWFFYEGNDYEGKLIDYDNFSLKNLEKKKISSQILNYDIQKKFYISNIYRTKVFIAELISGLSFFAKYFKKYENLLNYDDYDKTLKIAKNFLDKKNVKKRYIYYIPSWQRLTNHKSLRFRLLKSNPQILQLNNLKQNVKEISEKNNFTFIDGGKFFMDLKNPLEVYHYKLNTHFNEIGYKYLAEDLTKNINKNEQN